MLLLLFFAVLFNWKRILIDVKNAFVNAPLKEEIYTEQRTGFVIKGKEEMVYTLNKFLYCLKQASREWFKHLHSFLVNNGFVQAAADPTVYTKCINNEFVILVFYVDDVLMFSSSDSLLERVLNYFQQTFDTGITNLWSKAYYHTSGWTIANHLIHLCQVDCNSVVIHRKCCLMKHHTRS